MMEVTNVASCQQETNFQNDHAHESQQGGLNDQLKVTDVFSCLTDDDLFQPGEVFYSGKKPCLSESNTNGPSSIQELNSEELSCLEDYNGTKQSSLIELNSQQSMVPGSKSNKPVQSWQNEQSSIKESGTDNQPCLQDIHSDEQTSNQESCTDSQPPLQDEHEHSSYQESCTESQPPLQDEHEPFSDEESTIEYQPPLQDKHEPFSDEESTIEYQPPLHDESNIQETSTDNQPCLQDINSDEEDSGVQEISDNKYEQCGLQDTSDNESSLITPEMRVVNSETKDNNALDSSLYQERTFSEVSVSLCNLLSVIENENCNGLDDQNADQLPSSNQNLDNNIILNRNSKPRSKRWQSNSLSDCDSSPSRKRRRLDIDETELFDLPNNQSPESSTSWDLSSNNSILKEIKQEPNPSTGHIFAEPNLRAVRVKEEFISLGEKYNLGEDLEDTQSTTSSANDSEGKDNAGTENRLPIYLQHFAKLRPSVIILRVRTLPNGTSVKVRTIKFDKLPLSWIFKDTFLANFDRCQNLRRQLDINGTPFIYTKNKSTSEHLYPVGVGSEFPFSCPKKTSRSANLSHNLAPPLATLASKKPSIASSRLTKTGKRKQIPTISFAEDMLTCAFKESLLSKFSDAPDARHMLNADHMWPDNAFEALDTIAVDCKFPFSFKDASRDRGFFDPLNPTLPASFLQQGHQLPPLPAHLKQRFYMARDYLLRLLGTTTYYIYSSKLAEMEGNSEKTILYKSIAYSLRPLVTSQANELGTAIVNIRESLLSSSVCDDQNIMLSLINGPVSFSHFFGNVKIVEKNMKNNFILLTPKET